MSTTRFKAGTSGNPKGRPRGIPDRRAQARSLFAAHRDELVAAAIKQALAGDVAAMRLCLERLVSPLKPTSTPVSLPGFPVGDLAGQGNHVLAQMAAGALAPDDAATVMASIAAQGRIIEVHELEKRITALEATANGK